MKGMFVFCAVTALSIVGCEINSGSSVVGSGNDTQINGVTFHVDTTFVDASTPGQLVARGTAKASSSISAPWYVEGQFYSDSTMNTKLGGNYTEIEVPLSSGQSTYWTIYFYTSAVDVRQFPGFRVSDLRAIYKN